MIAAAATGATQGNDGRGADRRLARRCATSPPERGAWEQLYALHAAGVRQWLRRGRRLGSDEGIEDLLQQVFLLCSQGALARYRGETSLRAYLLRIAERVRISENRRLTRKCRDVRSEVSLDGRSGDEERGESWKGRIGADDSLPHSLGMWCSQFGRPADELLEERERLQQINALVDALDDPRDRRVLRDYFWERRTDREIGAAMGVSINTVTWRRHRAQARLEEAWRLSSSGDATPAEERPKGREGKKP